jgi:hypothetical protein
MKLKNKKTGEVINAESTDGVDGVWIYDQTNHQTIRFDSLAELNEEWEDYEEPKEYWYIYADKPRREECGDFLEENFKAVGNYFDTREEAEQAVRKLKAWKRLKDDGITFKNWTINQTGTIDCFATWGDNIPPSRKDPTLLEDLAMLFGGEE